MHYTHALQMCSCMWIKDGIHFEFYCRQYSELPSELPTVSILESRGLPLSCPMSCPLYPYMEIVGSLIWMTKFPWAAHSVAHWAGHFFKFQVVRCPLSFLLFPYMEVVSCLIFMTSPCFASQEFNNYTIAVPSYA